MVTWTSHPLVNRQTDTTENTLPATSLPGSNKNSSSYAGQVNESATDRFTSSVATMHSTLLWHQLFSVLILPVNVLTLGARPWPVNFVSRQECIPVGCVPPAHRSYLRISSYPTHAPPGATTHAPPQTNHTHPREQPRMPPRATMHTPLGATMHAPPEQPHMPPRSNHTCPPRATTHAPQSNHTPPPME